MSAAIVPIEAPLRDPSSLAFLENAVQVDDVAVVANGSGSLAEEIGRRHLFVVASKDQLLTTRDGADGVPGRNLRSFIKDDNVKQVLRCGQVLRN